MKLNMQKKTFTPAVKAKPKRRSKKKMQIKLMISKQKKLKSLLTELINRLSQNTIYK